MPYVSVYFIHHIRDVADVRKKFLH